MVHLIWTLLNVGLFLFFISICFRATKLIRTQMGLWASIVFVIGLLSLAGFSGNKSRIEVEANKDVQKNYFTPFSEIRPNTMKSIFVTLDKDLISNLELGILYGEQITSNKLVAYDAYTVREGFVSGFQWTSVAITNLAQGAKLTYYVIGTLNWKLLGITVYSEPKRYSGAVILKKE